MAYLDLTQAYRIVISEPHPAARLAARELQTTLARICGQEFPISDRLSGEAAAFVLTCQTQEQDGFEWSVSGGQIRLSGSNPRSLLYAVYSFLETLGCCWFAPGETGASIPRGAAFELPDSLQQEKAAIPGRCLIIGHHAFMQDAPEWVIWAARNRINTIFFHTTTGALALGAVHESQYEVFKPVVLPLMQERGMVLEHGGHGLTGLLPRSLSKTLPEAFRWHNGQRSPDHNFCPTNQKGLQVIRKNAEQHFRARPEVDIFHLWGDDIEGGGWCSCPGCRGYSASEQLLLATNAIAEVLADVAPSAQISFIAYHDTEAVPVKVRPLPNVHMLWAPRMRCYAHAADDPACKRNVPLYEETLKGQVAAFQTAGAAPARVFEYYLDAVLFKSLLPPLLSVIQRDAKFYRDAGVHTVQALMTGDYAWISPQINTWLFPRLLWDPEQDLDALIRRFSRAAYGVDLLGYFLMLEELFRTALDIVPEQVKITVVHGIRQIWQTPPADMGDPVFAPVEALAEKLRRKAGVPALIEKAENYLAQAAQKNDRIRQEQRHFELVRHWLLFDLQRTRLYLALKSKNINDAHRYWEQSWQELQDVYRWGEENITSPRHRLNFYFIQFYTWQIRLNKIKAENLSNYPGKCWIAAVTKLRLLRLYNQIHHLFSEFMM